MAQPADGSEGAGAGERAADYRLAATGREAAEDERLSLLEQLYDPVSRRRRSLVQPGWRCLEVLPALFERCGLAGVRHEASTEVVRGGSPWARWWAVTVDVINELGGGGTGEAYRRELEVIKGALADPTVWLMRELLHACWGRRARDVG